MEDRLKVLKMYKLFIGGKFTRTESERYLDVFSRSGEKLCNISHASVKDLRNAVVAARGAFPGWSSKTGYERGQILYRIAEMLESRKLQFADEISVSLGNKKNIALKEVEHSIDRIIWYAGASDKWMQVSSSVNPVQNGYFNFSIPEPVGVIGLILPDTDALLALVTAISSCIVSGNTCIVLSPDSLPLPSLSFSEVLATSDIPGGVVNILTGKQMELIPALAGHMDVNSIAYYGNSNEIINKVKLLSAESIKRVQINNNKITNDDQFENMIEIDKFAEIKTIWHTMDF